MPRRTAHMALNHRQTEIAAVSKRIRGRVVMGPDTEALVERRLSRFLHRLLRQRRRRDCRGQKCGHAEKLELGHCRSPFKRISAIFASRRCYAILARSRTRSFNEMASVI